MPSGCHEWNGTRRNGYGRLSYRGKIYSAHRIAWELVNGPIPDGILLCHSCDNPPCCNIEHLWLGTSKDNSRDMSSKGRNFQQKKIQCRRGHFYNEVNTYNTSEGKRACRECHRLAQLRYTQFLDSQARFTVTRRGYIALAVAGSLLAVLIGYSTANICWTGAGYGSCTDLIDQVGK